MGGAPGIGSWKAFPTISRSPPGMLRGRVAHPIHPSLSTFRTMQTASLHSWTHSEWEPRTSSDCLSVEGSPWSWSGDTPPSRSHSCSPAHFRGGRDPSSRSCRGAPAAGPRSVRAAPRSVRADSAPNVVLSFCLAGHRRSVRRERVRAPSGRAARDARSFAAADLREVLPHIGVPTHLLYGDQDVRAPLTVADDLHAAIPVRSW